MGILIHEDHTEGSRYSYGEVGRPHKIVIP